MVPYCGNLNQIPQQEPSCGKLPTTIDLHRICIRLHLPEEDHASICQGKPGRTKKLHTC